MPDSIFLDNQSTTPTDPRVRDAMLPFLEAASVGNPHSEHVAGRRTSDAVERARAQVAELIGARPEEIVFTSGATEANNIALQGILRSPTRPGNHVVTCATEHKCVLETAAYLSRSGFRAEVLPVELKDENLSMSATGAHHRRTAGSRACRAPPFRSAPARHQTDVGQA